MNISMEETRKLIDLMPGYAVAYLIREGIHRLSYTKALPELSGYTPEEYEKVSKGDASQLIFEEDRETVLQQLKAAIDKGTEVTCGYRVQKKDGSTVHVNVRARQIGKMDGSPVFLSILTKVSLDEQQLDMMNKVPVGMGIYEVEAGIPSLVFLNDSYYRMMGFSRTDRSQYLGRDTIHAVHLDDRPSIFEGIQKVLTGKARHFRTVIRMVTEKEGCYHWLQLEGRIAGRSGAVTTFYVSFTKIDELQDAKAELEKNRAFMQSAMDSANIQYFEYYPMEHAAVGRDTKKQFGLPQRVENYPESLFENKIVYEDDMDSLRRVFDEIDAGKSPASWEGRLFSNGKYRWFRCVMTSLRDTVHGRMVVACTLFDIAVQKEAEQSYRNHLDSIMRANPDAISTFRMNLTDNLCQDGFSIYENIRKLKDGGSVDEFMEEAEGYIPDEAGRRQFRAAFSRKALLAGFAEGKKKIAVEHRYTLQPGDTEWITTTMDLMKNPETGDVEAILYTLNTNLVYMERFVLQNILQKSYDAVSVVDMESDEYFMFERLTHIHGKHFAGFSKEHDAAVRRYMSQREWEELAPRLSYGTVQKVMKEQGNYAVNYFAHTPEGVRRKQVSYYFSDSSQKTMIAALRDFSDQDLLEQFRYASEHDPVTDLYNRQKTFAKCRQMLEKHPGEKFYVCHMDIQRFHLINSFYGEEEGDTLLKSIGRLLAELSKNFPYAVYGRIEADIFFVSVPAMKEVLEENVRLVKDWLRDYRKDFLVEANFGAYEVRNPEMSIEAMFARATLAAKHSHNSIVYHYSYFDDAMEEALQKEQQISNDMRMALEQEQFKVYLQPKYILKNSRPCGAEALVRWEHPIKGMISPGDFIPLFEKNGFIIQLDRYMWERVCLLLREWLDAGQTPSPISVNVSRVSMYSPTTVSFLHDLVEKYQLPHELLQLELTESAYMDDPEEMKRRLRALQEDGFTILMDDFGSGYSSLNTLRELPVDYLKIDMRFLAATEDGDRSRLILSSVVRMACWLNLPVIIEGVETPEQKEFLNGIGCTYAQGFLFARPMPVTKYEQDVLQREEVAAQLPEAQLSVVISLLSNTSEIAHFLSERIPMPMAFVDVTEREFAYMRANQEFQDAFGFGRDLIEKQQLLQEHLTKEEYKVLMNAFHNVTVTREKSECLFYWKAARGGLRCYLMRAQYLGSSTYSTVLLATFMDVTSYSRFANQESGNIRAYKNRYRSSVLNQFLQLLGNIFEVARVVLPDKHQPLAVDAEWNVREMPENCYGCWGKTARCDDCISKKAMELNRTMFKVEKRGIERYFVFSYPIEIVKKDETILQAVLELVTKPNELSLTAVSDTKAAEESLVEHYRQLSYRDPLTAAWNRRYYTEMIFLAQNDAFQNDPSLGFILLDLYNFKRINDSFGHRVGDAVLVEVATELRHNIRSFDSLIRYDGDEFLVALPTCTKEQVKERAIRLRTVVEKVRFGDEKTFALRVNVGYSHTARLENGTGAIDRLLEEADQSLMRDAHKKTE